MMIRTLKTVSPYWELMDSGIKTHDLRPDDRQPPFAPEDILVLAEWDPDGVTVDRDTQVETLGRYTGRVCVRKVTHVLRDAERFGLRPGFVDLSLAVAPTR